MTAEEQQPEAAEPAAPPEKLDPESFALRGTPARSIRFKRGAVVGIAAVGVVSLIGTAWYALQPSALHLAAQADQPTVASNAPTDALNALPGSYDKVPKLGPPLPGDLGRPILEQQRELGIVSADGGAISQQEQAAAAERERRAAELKTARESELMVSFVQRQDRAAVPDAAAPETTKPAAEPQRLAIDADRDPNAQQRKADFIGTSDAHGDVERDRLKAAASPDMLSAGSVIAASLITGLRSDLPGLVIAQVTERVFDSATGSILLIPQGSRLIGSYDSVVAFGQSRALIVWQRIIMPDGSSIRLDNVPSTDPSGYAGLADKIDRHGWELLKGVAISTLLGVGTNASFGGDGDLVQAIRESTQQNVSRAGDQITSRNLSVQPTITIRPGAPVRLIVHRDLILAPWRE